MSTTHTPPPAGADPQIEVTRARAGMLVVLGSDLTIAVAAILGVLWLHYGSGANSTEIAAILTSAFTTIGTMTTAYFGIKSMSNTALSIHQPEKAPEVRSGPAGRASSSS